MRADGYFAITNFDIADRYIIDALIRNDGSSLFGRERAPPVVLPPCRRVAAVGRVVVRPAGASTTFKLRYSLGTAGGRPSLRRAVRDVRHHLRVGLAASTLGNNDLKPEFATEHEAGFDLGILNNRATLTMNYARSVTEDQILPLPLPAYTGYSTRTVNAGTLESNTWELSLDTRLVERGSFSLERRA